MRPHQLLHGGIVLTERLEQLGLRLGEVNERLDLALEHVDTVSEVGVLHRASLRRPGGAKPTTLLRGDHGAGPRLPGDSELHAAAAVCLLQIAVVLGEDVDASLVQP